MVYIEREAFAAAVLVGRMEEARLASAPVWDDVCTFDARPWRGLVDLVAGGTPCQDLSDAGKRAGLDGSRSRLFFEHVRIAVECEAPFFFWENVRGATGVMERVCTYLEERGYRGAWTVVRASDVGAPHQRARVFLLAYSARLLGERGRTGTERDRCAKPSDRRARLDPREPLADRDGDGLEAPERGRDGLGAFPPGRADLAGWARVLAVRPDLAPALPQPRLRGVADGVERWPYHALRVDRLRACGNGVVPAQAAHAWRGLWAQLFGGGLT